MKNNFILTDVDGVLLDWCTAFEAFMEEEGYVKTPDADNHYFLHKRYYGLEVNEAFEIAANFNKSDQLTQLPAYKDALEGINEVKRMGYEIICVTSIGECTNVRDMRIENLDRVFGPGRFDHSNLTCIPIGTSKYEALKRWAGSGALWVEDHFSNAEAGYEVGLSPIVVDTPYNRCYSTDLFPRTSEETPWKDIVAYLKRIENE